MSATTDRASPPAGKKPRLALFLATGFGLGYLPVAPGTWGSLLGIALATSPQWVLLIFLKLKAPGVTAFTAVWHVPIDTPLIYQCWLALALAALGLWTAGRAARYLGVKDPRMVVIDEVSGQQVALLAGGFWPRLVSGGDSSIWFSHPLGLAGLNSINWKYLLLGFILFRVFDIWKPFPVRHAEHLPGGWGIMADDWVAAIYAALGLWLARALGL